MPNMNIFIEEDYLFKFRELKTSLKCRNNEETFKKLIDITHQHLQQNALQDQQNASQIQQQKESAS